MSKDITNYTTFVTGDLSQIEARVLAWLSNDFEHLARFERGEDIYCYFAQEISGQEVIKPADEDESPEAKLMRAWRQLGKKGELGLGYGSGGDKFHHSIITDDKIQDDIRPLIQAGKITRSFANRTVKTWRSLHAPIVDWWEGVFDVCMVALNGGCMKDSGKGLIRAKIKPSMIGEGVDLWVRLPSGRCIIYHNALVYHGMIAYQSKVDEVAYLYGSKLAENITQAVARDVITAMLVEAVKAGLDVVLSTHDSITSRDINPGLGSAVMAHIMGTHLSWTEGLPLAAEIKKGVTL